MITIDEACKIVLGEREAYITNITDIGRGYVIGSTDVKHQIPYANPVFVDKDTGLVSVYIVPMREHFEELRNGKDVKVPDEYWFGGMID